MPSYDTFLTIDAEKTFLSGIGRIFKTDHFVKETRRMSGVDEFITKLAEAVFFHQKDKKLNLAPDQCFLLSTTDGEHTFFFQTAFNIKNDLPLQEGDIVFFKYIDKEKHRRSNDQRFIDYFLSHKTFSLRLNAVHDESNENDFKKVYRLANSDQVNFPLLSEEQKSIVMLEDKNVLVQGVAGSGKTNICIDKIIWSACRSYAGKVLYSTYSRGLLIETKTRVLLFKKSLQKFLEKKEKGLLVFCDNHKKEAIENKLGVFFSVDTEEKIYKKIEEIILFLETKVDYYLLEDLYGVYQGKGKITDEHFFIKEYIGSIKNYRLSGMLDRIKNISYEVIYKEIFGMIFGSYSPDSPSPCLTQEEYIEARKDDFGKAESEIIYSIALDYGKHLEKCGLVDNNLICRNLLGVIPNNTYSLAILDEVQDFTQINLYFFSKIAFRLFCVGDALQMINPSYFGFAYLKRLLFKNDEAKVAELKHNYRNTEKIENIIEELGKINVSQFGTHSFVLKGQSVESDVQTATVYLRDNGFAKTVADEKFDNITIVCTGAKQKEELRKILKKPEILTISEIKGLERDTVLLYNILSDNKDKWNCLARRTMNRKTADENSVYRYYFNLFYVGVSRAKQYLYVTERNDVDLFEDFFLQNFTLSDTKKAVQSLSEIVRRTDIDQEEIIERTKQFISLGQYDNARFTAEKIEDDALQRAYHNRINVNEEFIRDGRYRDAGIRYWELGMTEDAKQMFTLSGDDALVDLVDAVSQGKESTLDPDILLFYPDLVDNEGARTLIMSVIQSDLSKMAEKQNAINKMFKTIKARRTKWTETTN